MTNTSTEAAAPRARASFNSMAGGTQEDKIVTANANLYPGLADRVTTHLRLLGDDIGGFQIDRLTHSLQTATRAYRANRDDEYVACALLHYLGLDRNTRDQFEGHPYYDVCAEFCADYDQPSLEPDYPTMALEEFGPLLRSFFASPKNTGLRSD